MYLKKKKGTKKGAERYIRNGVHEFFKVVGQETFRPAHSAVASFQRNAQMACGLERAPLSPNTALMSQLRSTEAWIFPCPHSGILFIEHLGIYDADGVSVFIPGLKTIIPALFFLLDGTSAWLSLMFR